MVHLSDKFSILALIIFHLATLPLFDYKYGKHNIKFNIFGHIGNFFNIIACFVKSLNRHLY